MKIPAPRQAAAGHHGRNLSLTPLNLGLSCGEGNLQSAPHTASHSILHSFCTTLTISHYFMHTPYHTILHTPHHTLLHTHQSTHARCITVLKTHTPHTHTVPHSHITILHMHTAHHILHTHQFSTCTPPYQTISHTQPVPHSHHTLF